MKINLNVTLEMLDSSWDLIGVEKEVELDFLPNVGDEVEVNGLMFKVERRIFNISKDFVDIFLATFEILNEEHKKDVLNLMEDSGWYYRDPEVYTLSEL